MVILIKQCFHFLLAESAAVQRRASQRAMDGVVENHKDTPHAFAAARTHILALGGGARGRLGPRPRNNNLGKNTQGFFFENLIPPPTLQ